MPRYDYRCQQCDHVYEKREGFDAPSVQVCPDCAGTARRVLTPPAIVFKGSGWYSTDNRKSGNGNAQSDGAAKSDEQSGTTSEPKSESTGQSKSESKPDSSGDATAKSPKQEPATKAAASKE